MSRKWTLLTLILSLGSSGALQANPLDPPGIVYIDGLPCNSACQSYMAASARVLSARHREERRTIVVAPAEAEIEIVPPAPRPRVARHPAPVSRTSPRAGIAASNTRILNAKTLNTRASNPKKAIAPNVAAQTTSKEIPAATATITPEKPVEKAIAGSEVPGRKLQSSDTPEPAPAALDIAAASSPGTASNKAREIGKASSASPDDADNLVALVLARPEINSLSDLNNKTIAITEKQSASSGRISAALMVVGAAEVQFSEVKSSAIDRLISGEVPAAVVLASRDVANLFPEVEGFRTFRVPLKARM
jgi:hypothetical protein